MNCSRNGWCGRSKRAGALAARPTGTFRRRSWSHGDEPFAYIDLRVDVHEEPIGELRRVFEWFRPLLPYYSERPHNPRLPRDDRWRDQQKNKRRKSEQGGVIDERGVSMRQFLTNGSSGGICRRRRRVVRRRHRKTKGHAGGGRLALHRSHRTHGWCLHHAEPLLSDRGAAGRARQRRQLVPALAEKWEAISPTHWRFFLRKGVKWHDGTPFTAADVKFTIDYVIDPKRVYARKTRIAGVTGAEVVDDHTVDIKTASPAPLLLRGLADIPIESEGAHREGRAGRGAQEADAAPAHGSTSTGWRGDRYDLAANPDYWGRRAGDEEAAHPRHSRGRDAAWPRWWRARPTSSRKSRSTCCRRSRSAGT